MRRVGEIEAKKLIWSGEKLPAEKAVRLKLADGLFSGDCGGHNRISTDCCMRRCQR